VSDKIYVDVILRDEQGRFLLQHHHNSQLKPWRFPGGKPEPGETLIGAAAREAKEELGIEPLSLVYIGKRDSVVESGTWTGHMFLCDRYIGMPHNVEESKHYALEYQHWFMITVEPEATFAKMLALGQVDGY
jgi:8-oxo-dGTP pyrophosphatase MutT (NUDIX family)